MNQLVGAQKDIVNLLVKVSQSSGNFDELINEGLKIIGQVYREGFEKGLEKGLDEVNKLK